MTPTQILTEIATLAPQLTTLTARLNELHNLYASHTTSTPSDLKNAIHDAALRFHVPPRTIMSRRRTEPVALARFYTWYILYQNGWTYRQIAKSFHRDHGAIGHGIRRYKSTLEVQPKLLPPEKQTLAA
jgi:chromosomal replication initiation ATPase DnaA